MNNKTLTKADIVEKIYLETGNDKLVISKIVNNIIKLMMDAIVTDGRLTICRFGSFEKYAKAARKGRNPKTGEIIILPKRNLVVFHISKKLKDELNTIK